MLNKLLNWLVQVISSPKRQVVRVGRDYIAEVYNEEEPVFDSDDDYSEEKEQ